MNINDPVYVEKLEHNELPLHPQPEHVLTPLNDIQRRNLSFMTHLEKQRSGSGFLLDDMGLGKTLSGLALISLNLRQATLIVVPKNVLYGWESELKKHIRQNVLSYKFYYGPNRQKETYHHINVVLTTYSTLREDFDTEGKCFKPESLFKHTIFDRIILDEGHVIRNRTAQQTLAVCEVMAEHRWCFSGTPIWNSLEDLYPLFLFIRAYPMADYAYFKRYFLDSVQSKPKETFELVCSAMVRFGIRHARSTILPCERINHYIYVDLPSADRQIYEQIKQGAARRITYLLKMYAKLKEDFDSRATLGRVRMNTVTLLTRLRQAATSIELCNYKQLLSDFNSECCCVCLSNTSQMLMLEPCHHRLCSACEQLNPIRCPSCDRLIQKRTAQSVQDNNVSFDLAEHRAPSAKTQQILNLLLAHPQDKFVIYTVWLQYLDILGFWCQKHGFEFRRIEGNVSAARRIAIQDEFTANPRIKVLLCSLTAAGVGLNLQVSNKAIIADVFWNEAATAQASSRIDRLGQRASQVNMYWLIARNTIDEQVLEMVQKKSVLALTTLTGTNAKTSDLTWIGEIRLMMSKILA